MGSVGRAFIPLSVVDVPLGTSLIVAGAIFSMVSASNTSIFTAPDINSLMSRKDRPLGMSRDSIHFMGTSVWSTVTVPAPISAFIVVFIILFGDHGLIAPISVGFEMDIPGITVAIEEFTLGLNALTGFATLNLLLPLTSSMEC